MASFPSGTLSSNTLNKQQNVLFRSKPIMPEADITMETYIANLQIPYYDTLDAEGKEKHLEKVDALELFVVVQDVKRELAAVKLENHFLTDFLEKNDPKLLIGLRQRRATASIRQQQRLTITSPTASPHSSAANVRNSASRRSIVGASQSLSTLGSGSEKAKGKVNYEYRLNYKAKSEMAEKAAADLERKIQKFEDSAMKEIRLLNANCEELRNRAEETDETARNFKLHFLSDQRDLTFLEMATEKQLERKFRKFVNNWLKNARSLLGTMRLRITTIQENCQAHRSMLLTKADLSGILGAIDFEQLQIKRAEYQKSLDEKNAYMSGLKGVAGRASLSMAEEKQEMVTYENKLQAISNKTLDVIKAIAKLEKETAYIEEENNKDEKTLIQLKDQLDHYDAPSVSEYIERKDELVQLEKEDKMLQRKIFILNMKLTNLYKKYRRDFSFIEKEL